jgi:PAS domain S-box-containing protein
MNEQRKSGGVTSQTPEPTASPWDLLPFGSLRGALLLLVGLAVLPAVGLALWTADEQREHAIERGLEEAATAARRAARDYRHAVVAARVMLKTIANLPEVRARDATRCKALLSEALGANAAFANLGLVDEKGIRICSAVDDERGMSLADRPYFRMAMERNRFVIGRYQIGRLSGESVMNFAYPVRDDAGEPRGVLYGLVDLRDFVDLTPRSLLPKGSALTVFDGQGRVLVREPRGPDPIGDTAPWHAEAVAAIGDADEGRVRVEDVDGVTRHYLLTRIGSAEEEGVLNVGVGVPAKLASGPADVSLERSLWALGGVALLTLLLAWAASGALVVRPVRRLVKDMRRLAAGEERGSGPDSYAPGEVGDLARSFHEMAATVRRRRRERDRVMDALADSKASLQAVLEAAQDGIVTIDANGCIEETSPTADETFGYEAGALIGRVMGEVLIPSELSDVFAGELQGAVADVDRPLFPPRADFVALRKSGVRFPVEFNTRRIPGEGPPSFAIYLRDLTHQRHDRRRDCQRRGHPVPRVPPVRRTRRPGASQRGRRPLGGHAAW